MITLTNLAASQLQTLFQQETATGHGLRIFVQGGGCAGLQYGMAFEDTAREGDTVVETRGIRLFVDPFSARHLEGACIDYQDSAMGAGFRVDNPNATVACACGLSFRTEGGKEAKRACSET
jgi:iron-sulfur cluster assembly accessory protein